MAGGEPAPPQSVRGLLQILLELQNFQRVCQVLWGKFLVGQDNQGATIMPFGMETSIPVSC
jgi:hypothetical protein